MKNGSAALDGRLRVGDMLVKIENESLINERHKKAVKMLQKAPKGVRLTVRRNHLSQRVSSCKNYICISCGFREFTLAFNSCSPQTKYKCLND
jgi:hypothetical protein